MSHAMESPPSSLLSNEDVASGLSTILAESEPGWGPAQVVARVPHPLISFFPIEVVTCLLGDGSTRQILLKRASGKIHSGHGHRGGLAHEAMVYRHILGPRRGSRPRFLGSWQDEA